MDLLESEGSSKTARNEKW